MIQRMVSISQTDWSLHRKGPIDQARHNEKVKEAIKDNLDQIIAEESIIMSDGHKTIKVPIRVLDEPSFRYDPGKQYHAGQGDGDSKVGDVIGQAPGKADPSQKGGRRAGDKPGEDYYEVEIDIEDLAAMLFADLGLPNLQPKASQELESADMRFKDIAKKGPMARLDKKRTIYENIKRNASHGNPHFGGITNDDLRFKWMAPDVKRQSNAVVIAMRDVSGSMGEFEKYITRSFYFWMVRFLRHKYQNVEIVFITHHTEAKEVDENAFFSLGESGGTRVSSAYQLTLETVRRRYDSRFWNVYPFHFSDGDNWGNDDNALCCSIVTELLGLSNLFGYGEIRERDWGTTTLITAFEGITDPRFVAVTITKKEDVWPALKKFFSGEGVEA